jgi:hypothetical protein
MTENDSCPDGALSPDRGRTSPDAIPGIIDGTMTLHPEPDGSVSFRVMIGINRGEAADNATLELIVGASHTGQLSLVLANCGAVAGDGYDTTLPFPCQIGFCRNPVTTAA